MYAHDLVRPDDLVGPDDLVRPERAVRAAVQSEDDQATQDAVP